MASIARGLRALSATRLAGIHARSRVPPCRDSLCSRAYIFRRIQRSLLGDRPAFDELTLCGTARCKQHRLQGAPQLPKLGRRARHPLDIDGGGGG
jgi:hypothetical protein